MCVCVLLARVKRAQAQTKWRWTGLRLRKRVRSTRLSTRFRVVGTERCFQTLWKDAAPLKWPSQLYRTVTMISASPEEVDKNCPKSDQNSRVGLVCPIGHTATRVANRNQPRFCWCGCVFGFVSCIGPPAPLPHAFPVTRVNSIKTPIL